MSRTDAGVTLPKQYQHLVLGQMYFGMKLADRNVRVCACADFVEHGLSTDSIYPHASLCTLQMREELRVKGTLSTFSNSSEITFKNGRVLEPQPRWFV